MDKNAVRAFAQAARPLLEASARKGLFALHSYRLSGDDALRQDLLLKREQEEGDKLWKEAAYRFFRELIAVRYMEVNGYLSPRVLSNPDPKKEEPELLETWLLTHQDTLDRDGLYTSLFLKTCGKLYGEMPDFFPEPDEVDLLLHLSYREPGGVVRLLCGLLPEEEFRDRVEVVGWLYQAYRLEEKDAAISLYAGAVKMEDVPAATQFFTTDWVVKYMVENSIGRIWLEGHPESPLRRELAYYVARPGGFSRPPMKPAELKLLDPSMGSGHILVYAFELLLKIYGEAGVPPEQAASMILRYNLYGLDIDERSRELAAFALLMKARSCDPEIFTKQISLHLSAVQGSRGISRETVAYAADGDEALLDDLQRLTAAYYGGEQFGSLITPPKVDQRALEARFFQIRADRYPGDLFRIEARRRALSDLWPLVRQARMMRNTFSAVVTNPPYLSHMDRPLRDFVNQHYRDYNNDLFAVFLVRAFGYCEEDGYCGFMTPFVWMFIKSYEPLRKLLIEEKSVSSLVQMEYSAFEEATVPVCTFVLQNRREEQPGVYLDLTAFKGGMEEQGRRAQAAAGDPACAYRYEAKLKTFRNIPGMPFAYWAGARVGEVFREGAPLSKLAEVSNGLFTCDNRRFLRYWYEVDRDDIDFWCADEADCRMSGRRWFPYNKGGAYHKWYGNQEYVVDFAEFGRDICAHRVQSGQSAAMPGRQYYFRPSLSWSFVSSSTFSARYYQKGFVFDIAGSSLFPPEEDRLYRLGFLCSSTAFRLLRILNPTLNYQAGNLMQLPILESTEREGVRRLVQRSIDLCKADWDGRETSWNFSLPPLLKTEGKTLPEAAALWEEKALARREELRKNEEAVNRHFEGLYRTGAPAEVPDKALSIPAPDRKRELCALASFFMGVAFGRYPCDFYRETPPRLLTPKEAAAGFLGFLRARFGEEAGAYAASFLGKGDPQAVWERYFSQGFFRDHCRQYHKRPIYWQLNVGEGAFLDYHGEVAAAVKEAAGRYPEEDQLQLLARTAEPLDKNEGIGAAYARYQAVLRKLP